MVTNADWPNPREDPMHLLRTLTVALVVCACLLLTALGPSPAAAGSSRSADDHSVPTYFGTVLANIFYIPAKIVFGAGGAVTSGLAYVVTLGDTDVSNSIWNTSVNGDYVVTPRMIEGRESVDFTGK
jgi:hypothetical protein